MIERRGTGLGLGAVLLCLAATLGLSVAAKSPCVSGNWSDGRQYRLLCYSDIVPLLGTEQLRTGSRRPYIDACADGRFNCDEYPVLSMYTMWVAAKLAPRGPDGAVSFSGFFIVNAAILAMAAVVTAIALYRMVGSRALYFALAPTLLIYAFVNWDLIAVAFATLGTLAHVNRRTIGAGVSLAAGASAKLYPGLLVVPFALERLRARRTIEGVRLILVAAMAWLAINVPFAVLGWSGWVHFYRFNSQRRADWDSIWYVACDRVSGLGAVCDAPGVVNLLSLVCFVVLSVIVWRLRSARAPGFSPWTFGFPLVVIFLLTNKVYSPQYGLWLLPWFALALPDVKRFAAFQVADVAVFVTRFAFYGQQDPAIGGWVDAFTIGWFQMAVLIRAAVLVWCIAVWVTGEEPAVSHGM